MQGIALTFDDGPSEHTTPALLDLLGEAGAGATFFVVGPLGAKQPRLIRRMVDEGHSVGLHCDQHVRHSDRDLDWCRRDTDRALGRLESCGVAPHLWRTPWGDVAAWTDQVASERGLRIVGWDLDTHDWRGDHAAEMFAATRPGLCPGAIVLAHDGIGPGARRVDGLETLAYVRRVIEYAELRGLPLEALA